MTQKRRIALNVIVTYGRSLYALALGLFTARWALQALGQTDFGLYGLVGGMVGIVSFLNTILATSVARFYAVGIGEMKRPGNETEGLENCRKWFNTALSVHTILPLILVSVGYPLGVWAAKHFLSIPVDRIEDCIWVWRFSCVTCFVTMVNVPFTAMYTAKQEIAELTLFSLFTTTANAVYLYYMVTHPRIWLAKYALGTCVFFVLPRLAIMFRAMLLYPECKVIRKYWFDVRKYVQLGKFAVAKFWSDFSSLFSGQGQSILVNKYMGPDYNASMTIGNAVAGHASTLSAALSNAFYPAVANLCGEGRYEDMKRFCFMTCRFGAVLILVFAMPLSLEIKEVLRMWLVKPPDFAAVICVVVLAKTVFERMTDGYWMAIYSKGYRVMKYSWTIGWSGILMVAVSWCCFFFGLGMWSIVAGLLAAKAMVVFVRLLYGRSLVGFYASDWLRGVFLPILAAVSLALLIGSVPRLVFAPSIWRVGLTTIMCEVVFLPLAWLFILRENERCFLSERFKAALHLK